MFEVQKFIYYFIGEFFEVVKDLFFFEVFKKKGFEVFFFVDFIDEYVVIQFKEFDGKKFVCVFKEGFEFEEIFEEKVEREKEVVEYEGFCFVIKENFGDKVEKVVIFNCIIEFFCVFVIGQFGWFFNMERIMKVQVL